MTAAHGALFFGEAVHVRAAGHGSNGGETWRAQRRNASADHGIYHGDHPPKISVVIFRENCVVVLRDHELDFQDIWV